MNVARALYSLLTWSAQPLLRRKLRRRAVAEPGYAHAVGERFGRYPAPIDSLMHHSSTDPLGRFVWVHAVSLGETRAAAILLAQLREQLPGMRLLLTHGTATGRAEGEKLLLPGDVQVWQPWDTPGAVARFLRKFRPAIGILMETEVWPNLVAGCRQRRIPLVLANARFNETSLRKAQRLSALARPAYGGLTAVWAQTQEDATRLAAIGAPVRGVLGNLKFDVVPDAAQRARGRAWRARSARPVVMLASSREGEEAMWLDVFKQNWHPALSQQAPAAINSEANQGASPVQWLVVPRHPQRFAEVQQLLEDMGADLNSKQTDVVSPDGVAPQAAETYTLDDRYQFLASLQRLLDLYNKNKQYLPEFITNELDKWLTEENLENFIDFVGVLSYLHYSNDETRGFDLIVSSDGTNFQTISRNGFGDNNNHGLRVFAVTDSGLAIGTANPYHGTQVWLLNDGEIKNAELTNGDAFDYDKYDSDKKSANANGLTVGINPNGNTVEDVQYDYQSLTAGTDYTVVGRLLNGAEVKVLEESNGWYKVDYKSVEGYMSGEYLNVSAKADVTIGYGLVQSQGSPLNVRSGPGTSYGKVTSLNNGAVVNIVGIDNGWYKISTNGVTGYVSSDYMVTCKDSAGSRGDGATADSMRNCA